MFSSIKSIFYDREMTIKSFYSLVLKIIGSAFGYLLLLLVGNLFNDPTKVWGEYTLFLAVLNITSIFSRTGIDKIALKLVAAADQDIGVVRSVYLSSLRLIFIISISCSIVVFLISEFLINNILSGSTIGENIIYLIIFIIPIFSIICLNENTLRGLKRIKEFSFFQRTAKMLFSVFFFLLLFFGFNIINNLVVIQAYIISLLLIFLLSSYRIYLILFKEKIEFNFISYFHLLKQALPMMLSSSILLLMSWADTLMLGFFLEDNIKQESIGIYNAAVKIALSATLVISAVNSIVAPKISESYNNNRIIEFQNIIYRSTRLIFYSTLPILVVIFFYPEDILFLFGKDFSIPSAVFALIILAISQAINAMSGSVGTILNMTGKQKEYGNILIVALFINILLNYILIPKGNFGLNLPIDGIKGAAIASSFSLIFWNVCSVIYIYKKYKVLTSISFIKK